MFEDSDFGFRPSLATRNRQLATSSMIAKEFQTDVLLIGAGPIGLEMAVALRRAGIDYLHLEAKQIGHTISWWAPATRFFSSNERIAIAGVPLRTVDQLKASREQYLQYLLDVVELFDLKVRTYEPIHSLTRQGDGFRAISMARGLEQTITARRVSLATGGTARPRMLDGPGEDLPHVSHYLQEPYHYFGRNLLIVGGRNSAVEAGLRCHNAGANVSLSYRRADFDQRSIKYWLLPEFNGLVAAGRIGCHTPTCVTRITPDHVTLHHQGDGKSIDVPADFVLAMIGYEADMTLARQAGISLAAAGDTPTFNPETMETDVPGLYIAGTAVGGTQARYQVFIENCHVHVERIIAALRGAAPPTTVVRAEVTQMPET